MRGGHPGRGQLARRRRPGAARTPSRTSRCRNVHGHRAGRRAAHASVFRARLRSQETRYTIADPAQIHRPPPNLRWRLVARYEVDGVPVDIRASRDAARGEPAIRGRHAGARRRARAGRHARPRSAPSCRLGAPAEGLQLKVEVLHNREGRSDGDAHAEVAGRLDGRAGAHAFQFARAGERAALSLHRHDPVARRSRAYASRRSRPPVAASIAKDTTPSQHRDLETRYLYRDAAATVRGVDVTIAPGLKVGYVMGVGDEVPAGIAAARRRRCSCSASRSWRRRT